MKTNEIKEPQTEYEKVIMLISQYEDKNGEIKNIKELIEILLKLSPHVKMWTVTSRWGDSLRIQFLFKEEFWKAFYIHWQFRRLIEEMIADYINSGLIKQNEK